MAIQKSKTLTTKITVGAGFQMTVPMWTCTCEWTAKLKLENQEQIQAMRMRMPGKKDTGQLLMDGITCRCAGFVRCV